MRVLRSLSIAMLLASMAAGAASADQAGAVTLAGFSVSAGPEADACVLQVSRGEIAATFRLPLPVPCALHVNADGTPRTMARGDDLFFLVESSKPAADGSQDCDTRIQAVRLDEYGADLAPHVERVASCIPMDWDDAVFLSMYPLN